MPPPASHERDAATGPNAQSVRGNSLGFPGRAPGHFIDRRRVGSTRLAITIRPDQAEQGAASRVAPQPGGSSSPARGRTSGRGPVGRDGATDLRLMGT